MSMLGAIFYSILAVMTAKRNVVFLEQKVGMNQFTWTDEEINAKFWSIAMTAIVRYLTKDFFCCVFKQILLLRASQFLYIFRF